MVTGKPKDGSLLANLVSWEVGQWYFRKTGTIGTLASQAEIGVLVQARVGCGCWRGSPAAGVRNITPEQFLRLYMQNPAVECIFGRKMISNAVHNAVLKSLTVRTPFPRVPHRNYPRCGVLSTLSVFRS